MKKKSVMQEDFEKFLKSLPKKVFVNTESDNGDWWYSFAFSENIYLALYSHQTDEFVRIQRVAGKEEADFDLFALMDDYLTEEDTLQSTGISKTYSIGGSSDGKYFYIYNN